MSSQTIRPLEAVIANAFTVVGAPTIQDAVDEESQDGDSSYVTCSTSGAFLVVRLQSHGVPDDGIIESVSLSIFARRVAGAVGDHLAVPVFRYGSTLFDIGFGDALGTSYSESIATMPVHPVTGQPWTPTTCRRLEMGLRIQVNSLPNPIVRVTQISAPVEFLAPTFRWHGIAGRAA